MMEGARTYIDEQIVSLTRKSRPKICLIATPCGDAESVVNAFEETFSTRAEPFVLTPFRKPRANSVPLRNIAATLLTMDAVFVSGGNTKSALGVWREWGIDIALRAAYESGVLISGMSAGASAWFEAGFSDSYGDGYARLSCLGWVDGGFCPHFNGEKGGRAARLLEAVNAREMPSTLAVDDYAAVLLEDEQPRRVFSWRENSGAYRITPQEVTRILSA